MHGTAWALKEHAMKTLAFAVAAAFAVSVAMAQTPPRLDGEGYDMDKPAPARTLGEGQVRTEPAMTSDASSWGPHEPVKFLDVIKFENRWSGYAVVGSPSPSSVETTGQR
jgi:hypothetical protein